MSDTSTLAARIDALLTFLPVFEQPEANLGTWKGGERNASGAIQMPWFDYSDDMMALIKACYANNWVDPEFDWTTWSDRQRYDEDHRLIAEADPETVTRLLTAHIRNDRFVEGHLASFAARGELLAILRRLASIRAEL